jgi:PAS domain-containing protein
MLSGDHRGHETQRSAVQCPKRSQIETAAHYQCVLGSIVLLGLIALSAHTVFRGIVRRGELFQEAHASRELLSTTFAGIGDAALVTDTLMRITLINRIAQSLRGWSELEAIGAGKVMGLVNNTRRIAKDGTRIFIDDSAAPIRNPEGTSRESCSAISQHYGTKRSGTGAQ